MNYRFYDVVESSEDVEESESEEEEEVVNGRGC